jgi:DNA-binding transcriptional ArsR family regulator
LLNFYIILLQTLITSKTRLRLLLKFFLNSNNISWLRDLESEFGESTNAIRVELNSLEKAGMLKSRMVGNKRIYRANSEHPLFDDIHNLLLKHTGIDQVVERIVNKIGGMTEAWLVGSFAKGMDSPVIDILMIGDDIDQTYLTGLIEKVEEIINRRIRYLIVSCDEKDIHLTQCPEAFQLWEKID